MVNRIDYASKLCIVAGSASPIGLAVTEMLLEYGAIVWTIDFKPTGFSVAGHITADFNSKTSIDKAIAALPKDIYAIFYTVDLTALSTTENPFYDSKGYDEYDVTRINYISARYLIEALIPSLQSGGAICAIDSITGLLWRSNIAKYKNFVSIKGFDEALMFLKEGTESNIKEVLFENADAFSMECLNQYAASRAWSLAERHIRFNTVCPSVLPKHLHGYCTAEAKSERILPVNPSGMESEPWHHAAAMVFLNSTMAGYISGVALDVDYSLATSIIYYGKGNANSFC